MLKMSARQRGGAGRGDGGSSGVPKSYKSTKYRGNELGGRSWPSSRSNTHVLPNSLVFFFLISLSLLAVITVRQHWSLPPPHQEPRTPNSFSSGEARKHMEDIVRLGIRHVGSVANEVHTVSLLERKLEDIRRTASDKVEIEISVKKASGSFGLNFPDSMTQMYRNVTNVVVKYTTKGSTPRHAVLLNAHYDSAVGSPAASDDAISCGTMLEILRCISSDPHPFLPHHSIIFLFNGAEETVLQASHGFITQHPWANEVSVFLNLEAAGAGGKEIVFQTGPDHPWLARTYAQEVPHPFASVIAQELFQSGVVPSDTDFRIFRDFGGVPGIDMAYFVNGYVYHTEYDTPDRIPDGSIQRAGENVLSMVQALGVSPYVEDPGSDRHGKVIFFDIFGLFSVVYPERIAIIFNSLILVGCAVSLFNGISLKPQQTEKPSLGMVIKALFVMLFSWLAALLVNFVTAILVTAAGRSLSWFTHTSLLLPLYVVPAALALAEVHSFWLKITPSLKCHLCEPSCKHGMTILLGTSLALLTYLHICSSFFIAMSLISLLVFRTLLCDTLLSKQRRRGITVRSGGFLFVLCEVLSVALPFMFGLLLIFSLMEFLVPIFGRSGGIVPPDLAIAIVLAVLVCLTCSSIIPFIVFTTGKPLRMVMAATLGLLYLTSLAFTLSGTFFPYSGGNQPAPKRLFLQHFQRKFHDREGLVKMEDSHVSAISADYLNMNPLLSAVPEMEQTLKKWPCAGVFCGLPSYLPLMKYINQFWYLPAPPINSPPPVSLNLISISETPHNLLNFTFEMKVPPRVSIFIAPRPGYTLIRWSLTDSITPPLPCNHKQPSGDQCYFIFYSRGSGEGRELFWLELEGPSLPEEEKLEIVVAAQQLDPPQSVTPTLTSLLASLPDWVTAIGWTSTYTSWTF